MPLSSTRNEPNSSFCPRLTTVPPVTGTAAGGCVAAGGGAVVVACGLHAAINKIKAASALGTTYLLFIFLSF
jgi:hypothetical protein